MRAFRAMRCVASGSLAGWLAACAGAPGVPNAPRDGVSAGAASADAVSADDAIAGSPVPAPRLGILGCVESRELRDYVLALDARRVQARRAALAALGATADDRRGSFGSAGAVALGDSYEAEGKRFAVAAELAPQ